MAFQSLYDEDLSENKFFQKLQNEHKILIDTAPLENWIVCVPRSAVIKPDNLNNTDFLLAHILIPHDEIPEQYTNLLGTDVKQFNGKLHIRSVASTILFEEVFYTKGLLKYKVWCIEWPLLLSATLHSLDDTPSGIFIVRGLQDAIALIWNETSSKAIFRRIESICESFMKNTNCTEQLNEPEAAYDPNTPQEILLRMKNSVEILLNHCFKKMMYQRRLYEKCMNDPHFRRVFRIALETYIMDLLYQWLFDAITIAYGEENEKFNRILRNLADANLKDFKLDAKHSETIGRVRVELMKITELTTPIEKMSCLRRAITAASQSKRNNISVDDLIPILVFIIIKSGLTHWIATLHFLKNFIFTDFTDSSDKGVDSFLITTLEATILYIESINLQEFKRSTSAITSFKGIQRRFKSKDHFIDYLFSKILAEDEVEIIKLMKTDKDVIISSNANNDSDESTTGSDECLDNTESPSSSSIMLSGNKGKNHDVNGLNRRQSSDIDDGIDEGDADEIDVISKFPESRLNLQNQHGIGAIHVAAMYGLPKMLNVLIALGADLHIKDENNCTPLHYASTRGHQNTLLLLLHAGADINAQTNDKNTALHLSCLNGHGNCVKALLYYSDHLKVRIDRNAQNKFGDTPLHMAAKWGFCEIIETLLEYGVRTEIENRTGQTALSLAHNSKILNLLQNAFVSIEQNDPTSDWEDQSTCSSLSASTTSLNQQSTHEVFRGCFSTTSSTGVDRIDGSVSFFQQKSNNDKIVVAIKNNDTKLACHFLGIELPEEAELSVCHPLCDCDKCKHITEYLSRKQSGGTKMTQTYDGDIDELSSSDGLTPLHAAIQMKNSDLIERILKMGAKLHIQSKQDKQTAIHFAVKTDSTEILNLVLNHIQSNDKVSVIDLQDSNGNTPLHLAVQSIDTQLVAALLKHEPNTRIRNSDGKTALDIAKSSLKLNVVRQLEVADTNDLPGTDSD